MGLVLDYDEKNKMVTLEVRNYFEVGYDVQFFGPNMETFNFKINKMYNDFDEEINVARHPKSIVKIPISVPLEKYAMMRIKVFDKNELL